MQGGGPRENIPKKYTFASFLRALICVLFQRVYIETCALFYLVYNSRDGIGIDL